MRIRNTIVNKETENRLSSITWDDCFPVFESLTEEEKSGFIDCLINGGDYIRNLFFTTIKTNIKNKVSVEIDGYISSGQIPLTVLNNILE
jgi:hypothetical protein